MGRLTPAVFVASLMCGVLTPGDLLCKDLEVSGYWGLTLFGETRKMTLDGQPSTSASAYLCGGGQAKLSLPWWNLFGFAEYRYAPQPHKLEGEPRTFARAASSSHVMAIGGGRHIGIGMARLGLKAGFARVHDSFTVIQFEETELESEVERSIGDNGLLLGCDFVTPVFESVGVALSYSFLYRPSARVAGDLPMPGYHTGDTWAITVGPSEHCCMIGAAFSF